MATDEDDEVEGHMKVAGRSEGIRPEVGLSAGWSAGSAGDGS